MMKKVIAFICVATCFLVSLPAYANSTTPAFDVCDGFAGAILEDGSLMMWGKNEYGAFGNGTTSQPPYDTEPLFEKTAQQMGQIAFGTYSTSYMLTKNGELYACGNNNAGQVGTGESSYEGVLTPHKMMDGVVKVGGGSEYALALKSDGTLWGIGSLDGLRLVEDLNRAYTPIKLYDNVKTFSCCADFCAIITTDGTLYTAGNGSHGNLGIGKEAAEDVTRYGFSYVADSMKYVACGKYNLFAIDENGALYSCGNNTHGELLNQTTGDPVDTLTKVIDGGVKSAAIWEGDAIYITENGELYGTGSNVYNQLGHRQNDQTDGNGTISKIADHVTDAAISFMNMLYRTSDGKLYMTGANVEKWGTQFSGKKEKLQSVADNKAIDISAVPAEKVIALEIGSNILQDNDREVALDVPAQIVNGRTMIPLRAIFEALGASVDWNDETQTVTAIKGNDVVTLQIGVHELYKNGVAKEMDVPAQIVNDRTLVPVRAVAESFGAKVDWLEASQTVTIVLE